jgi:hypothetical protein
MTSGTVAAAVATSIRRRGKVTWRTLSGASRFCRMVSPPKERGAATKSGQDTNFSISGGWHLFPFDSE